MKFTKIKILSLLLLLSTCKENEVPDRISEVELVSPVHTLVLGTIPEVQLIASAFDKSSTLVTDVNFFWNSSDPSIATVSDEGLVTFLSAGEVEFSVMAENKTASTVITIEGANDTGILLIQNANIIDVSAGNLIMDQDILIENGKIKTIAAGSTLTSPPNATVIDATDKYLIPGLSDAHVHVYHIYDFVQYLANGITSVIDMGNSAVESPAIDWKNSIIKGELEGPNFYPSVLVRGQGGGRVAANAAEARAIVAAWSDHDFIKSYSFVPPDAFDALIEEGAKYGMTVIGHGNRNLGLAAILQKGQKMIAHAEEYLYVHYSSNPTPAETSDAIAKTLSAGAYVTATLATYEAIAKVWNHNEAGYQEMLARPGVEFTNQIYKPGWENQFENRYNQPGSLFGGLDFQKEYVKDFHDAGIPFLLGTDSPVIVGMAAGFSIHEEMRLISEAGISNADILKMGTKNFGEFVKKYSRNKEDFGQVKEGFRADLVLLDANPIDDLNTLKDPAYVMVRGKLYEREYLKGELEQLRN